MGRYAKVKKKLTIFDLRFYRYFLLSLYIKTKKQLKARLKHG